MIGVAVRVGDPLGRLSVPITVPPEIDATIGSLAVPVGLAIDDDVLRGVNLLPSELKGQRKKVNPLHVALPIAAVVPIAAMGILFLQANGEVSDRNAEISAIQAQIDALPEPTRPTVDPALALDQQQRATALAAVLGQRLPWDRVLGDVSRVLPANVWLTHFTARTPDTSTAGLAAVTPGSPTTPTGVSIEGYTYRLTDVAVLLSRLETVPSLTNVSLGSSERKTIGKKQAISFTIIADIDGNGGAQ
jgi:Tfp pilus assembly protein PilN